MMRVDYIAEYDRSNPLSIEVYSQKMVGKTFREICEEDDARQSLVLRGENTDYGTSDMSVTKRNKGNLGQIVEEKFFTMLVTVTQGRISLRRGWN